MEEKQIKEEVPQDQTELFEQQPPEAQEVEEPKRGRGRPKGSTKNAPEAVGIPRKGKGGKAKEEPSPKAALPQAQSPEFFGQQIYGVHQLLTVITQMDLTISQESAQQLGAAVYEVVKEHNLEFLNKYTPIINLAVTAAVVELPVIFKAQQALKEKGKEKKVEKALKSNSPAIDSGDPLRQAGDILGGFHGQALAN